MRRHLRRQHPDDVSFRAGPRRAGPRSGSADAAERTRRHGLWIDRSTAVLLSWSRRPTAPVTAAAVLAIAATALGVGRHATGFRLTEPLALLATAPLALIRWKPILSVTLVLTANAGFLLFGRLSWPAAAMVAWVIALGACPVLLSRGWAWASFVAVQAVVAGAVVMPARINETPWDASVGQEFAVTCAFALGLFVGVRRRSAARRASLEEQVRGLEERDALTRERARIARELHDVIAHHVSMIAVRAATAPYALADLPKAASAEFGEIAGQARAALEELRTVLGMLRADQGAMDRIPQPRLADLPDLLDRMPATGTRVTFQMTGTPRPLPESVELCGYRIIQEALTNSGRHAAGSHVAVELGYASDALRISIRDDGTGVSAARGSPSAAGGFGLMGMRERVAMLGGEFKAGPDQAGGFRVAASLPAPARSADQREP
jgi:signal transduction histidine kinase